jgi:hypothetical protein
MIAHPFEIKPSTSKQAPDELMITWGNTPSLSVASIYLPAVAAADIIALADKMYVKHRLSAIDAHTIRCPAGDVTLVPIPQGQGRYAGLLSVDLPPKINRGDVYTIAVRQLALVSATTRSPPPPPQQPKIAMEVHAPEVAAPPKSFSWRQVVGAFQYTLTVTPGQELLYPQERLLAWLKWRVGVTPSSNRWLPVLQRYLSLTEGLVQILGQNPNTIPPSQVGNVPGKHPVPPCPPPVPPCPPVEQHEYTGKVSAIHYDRFGDFCGFVILTEAGHEHRFRGREHAIEELVHQAWVERTVVSVLVEEPDRTWPVTLILRRYH